MTAVRTVALRPRVRRGAASLIWSGVALHLLGLVLVAVAGLREPSPLSPVALTADRFGVIAPLGLVPPALAALALVRRDRVLLGLATALLPFAVPATYVGSVLALPAWLAAFPRLPHRANLARPLRPAGLVAVVGALLAVAVVALTVHRDPGCWTFVEDADGERTYEPAPERVTEEAGFTRQGYPIATGLRSEGGSQEVAPGTGEVVAEARIEGEVCIGDRVTPLQATGAGVASALAVLGAWRFAARRPDDHGGED